MKFVVKPPARTTTRTGLFCQRGWTPCSTARLAIGLPAAIPKAMQLLMIPAKIATSRPLRKSNSFMAARFCSVDSSLSLDIPAQPQTAIPSRQTTTPARMIRPEVLANKSPKLPKYIGGIIVPNAAQNPSAIAYPRDIPRYRIESPNVRPPMPHSTPKT